MQKICHLTSAHKPTDTRIFYKECKTLVAAGYNVTLIVQNDNDKVIDGVQILGVATPKNRRERMLKTTKQVYKRALECNADIYHFHDPELIPIGLRLKRRGKKVIYDVHEDVPRQILSKHWIPVPFRKSISRMVEHLENYGVKRFDCILTATPFLINRFVEINRCSIDINNFSLLSELYEPDINWNIKEKQVCYIGGVSNIRGIHQMVEAIGTTQYILLFAGSFESSVERDMAIKMEGWNKVIDLGYINRTEVKNVLSKSMVGLVLFHPEPNHIKAQPIKMFEYMSAGIPVIASNFPLWKEIIEGNNCGICVDPLNVNEITNAINWIMENPMKTRQMGENGRRAVEEKYNWEYEAVKLLKIYEEV
ncbi:MAG: glycosyltransferase family 4 protein [Oscillospiraceae bacterium]